MFLVCVTHFSTKCFYSSVELRLERFHTENRLTPQLSKGGLLLGHLRFWLVSQTHGEGGGQPAQPLQGSASGEGAVSCFCWEAA